MNTSTSGNRSLAGSESFATLAFSAVEVILRCAWEEEVTGIRTTEAALLPTMGENADAPRAEANVSAARALVYMTVLDEGGTENNARIEDDEEKEWRRCRRETSESEERMTSFNP